MSSEEETIQKKSPEKEPEKEPKKPKTRTTKKKTPIPDQQEAPAEVDAAKRVQESSQVMGSEQTDQTGPPVDGPGDHFPTVSMISQERLEEQLDDLRGSNVIRNDKGDKVPFEGEDKEQFIQFVEEGYTIAAKMVTTMTEAGKFLHEVREVLKPKKLFLTWMRVTGFPERTSYNYMNVYERFGEKLPQFSHLGIRKLLAAAHLKDCVEYVEKHEPNIARKTSEDFEKEIRRRVKESKKNKKDGRGRTPTYTLIGECKVRLSGDGTRIAVEGLSKKRQKALSEVIKDWLSQEIA